MVCINIAKRENGINAALTKVAGLEEKVIIPGEKSFFDTGVPDSSCDVVCSQDALLHAGSERHRALAEAARVLKPGGRMVFTDIMQSEGAEAKDLQEVRGAKGQASGGRGGRRRYGKAAFYMCLAMLYSVFFILGWTGQNIYRPIG